MSAEAAASTRPAGARRAAAADTASAIRRALRSVVATEGFHGASMAKVAATAGVAVGTAYVHYASKAELVLAAYVEVKRDLANAAVDGLAVDVDPPTRFRALWHQVHRHLCGHPERARFLLQVDASPFAEPAHRRAALGTPDGDSDPLIAEAARPELASLLAPLPERLLYELAFGPAVWLAAHGVQLTASELDIVAEACWRAVTSGRAE